MPQEWTLEKAQYCLRLARRVRIRRKRCDRPARKFHMSFPEDIAEMREADAQAWLEEQCAIADRARGALAQHRAIIENEPCRRHGATCFVYAIELLEKVCEEPAP